MRSISSSLRFRLLPALLVAIGVALLATGLNSYTMGIQSPPTAQPLPTYVVPSKLPPVVVLPGATDELPTSSFPADRVSTRIVIKRLDIDLPVMLQTSDYGEYPLCDVAMYLAPLGQPGQGRATYIYAHAQTGMFLPLLEESKRNNGQRMLGMTVEVYTSDDWRFLYTITEVRRHTLDLEDAIAADTERIWLQTSEGPRGHVPKLQVVGDFLSAEKADPRDAHPEARPRICG